MHNQVDQADNGRLAGEILEGFHVLFCCIALTQTVNDFTHGTPTRAIQFFNSGFDFCAQSNNRLHRVTAGSSNRLQCKSISGIRHCQEQHIILQVQRKQMILF